VTLPAAITGLAVGGQTPISLPEALAETATKAFAGRLAPLAQVGMPPSAVSLAQSVLAGLWSRGLVLAVVAGLILAGGLVAGVASQVERPANGQAKVAPTAPPNLQPQNGRPLAAGSLDPTFGTRGVVHTPIGIGDSGANHVLVQPDGKTIAVGYANWTGGKGQTDFAITRLNPDGTLDASFGTGGIATVSFRPGQDVPHCAALQPDGKIVVSGYSVEIVENVGEKEPRSSKPWVAIARLNQNGTLDTSFGESGRVLSQFATQPNLGTLAYGVAMQADGKLVVAGSVGRQLTIGQGNSHVALLARYLPDGALDAGFAAGGKLIWNLGDTDVGTDGSQISLGRLVIQPDGAIVVVGSKRIQVAQNPPTFREEPLVVRLMPSGQIDPSFGGDRNGDGVRDGYVLFGKFGPGDPSGKQSVALQGSSIVWAGRLGQHGFGVARLTASGDLDPTFGKDYDGDGTRDGFAVVHAPERNLGWSSMADMGVDAKGRVVIAGTARGPAIPNPSKRDYNADYAFARFTADGSLDTTFGTGGVVQYDLGDTSEMIRGMTVRPDGTTVAAAFGKDPATGRNAFTILRLLGN
jgi:uncharacterized delta-60 repeat protein